MEGGSASLFETGVADLDLKLGGGVPRGDLLLLLGPEGSGKTTLALHVAFNAARIESVFEDLALRLVRRAWPDPKRNDIDRGGRQP